ncbi:MAG: hypothetical protein RL367_364 [Pseudomonadota bacterium]|jgi:hypothetical protein
MTNAKSVSQAMREAFPAISREIAEDVARQFDLGIPIASMRDGEIIVRRKGQADKIVPSALIEGKPARHAA